MANGRSVKPAEDGTEGLRVDRRLEGPGDFAPAPPDPSLPARLREFHQRLPLAGNPPNALLSLPDDRILFLAAALRDTPVPAPALSPEEWREFLDLLRPHGIHALLAYRLRRWPEECRPPTEVMGFLQRLSLYATMRTRRVGRYIWHPKFGIRGSLRSIHGHTSIISGGR